jgi:hypothetical protein
LTASNTSAFAQAVFGVTAPAFRILAPLTLQRAAFEEHCRADTRAIMYGVLLDVEYESLYL